MGDFQGVLLHEVLNSLALRVDTAIVCHRDVHQLLAHLDLLGRYIHLRPSPCVELRDVIGLRIHVFKTDLLFSVRRAVVQIRKLHLVELFVAKEDLAWAEIGVDHVLAVDQLKQVNDLKADVNRLNLSEEGRLAFDLAARHYRFLHGCIIAGLGK